MQSQTNEEFSALIEATLKRAIPVEGETVKGKVIKVTPDSVIVDFGYKREGAVRAEEFKNYSGEMEVKEGDDITVYFEVAEDDSGFAILSREKAEAMEIWDRLEDAVNKDGTVEGVILARVKGGMFVDIGVKAFLPGSQIDVRPVPNMDKLVGKKFKFKILKLNKRKGNVIVSRRAILEKDRDAARQEIVQNLKEGQSVTGTIKNVTDYGVFIDMGGIDGLLHITDMTWGRLGHPSELCKVGDDITVRVLKIDPDTAKVSLGLKQLSQDPWENVPEKYAIGNKVRGKVTNIADYGAFVELETGVEGLVHISEMSWTRKVKHPSKLISVGDIIDTLVLDFDVVTRRISLGMRQVYPNPWEGLAIKYPVGARLKGTVKNVTEFGVFIGLPEEGPLGDIDGLVHVSDMTWTRKVGQPQDQYKKGDEVEAVVLNIDADNERFSLGIKQLHEDPWARILEEYKVGTKLTGEVTSASERGVAVTLEPAVEGFIPADHLPEEYQKDKEKALKTGDKIDVVVHSIDEKDKKITLGLALEEGGVEEKKPRKKAAVKRALAKKAENKE